MKCLWIIGIFSMIASPILAQTRYERAERAANIIGIGRSGACSSCHATNSEQTLRRWAQSHRRVLGKCLGRPELTAKERLFCLSDQNIDEELKLRPHSLGFWSAALHLSTLTGVLQDALGEDASKDLQSKLRETTVMPLRANSLLTETEFQEVRSWVEEGMPYLSELLAPYQGPTQCEAFLAPELKDHLQWMQDWGWKKRNADRGLNMFACGVQQDSCFVQQKNGQDIFPDVSSSQNFSAWKADTATQLRQLDELKSETQYWIRASADGRFIAYGGEPSGVIDLQSRLTGAAETRKITVDALYDPGFFPDDSAFVFQGNRTAICSTSLLKNPNTQSIDFSEDACTTSDQVQIPLYQAIGASLDGSDYLAATGEFVSDIGDGPLFHKSFSSDDLLAAPRSRLYLQSLEFDGVRWVSREPQVFDSAWEKDWGLAPSNRLIISRLEARVNGAMKHIGYQLYQLKKQSNPGSAAIYNKSMVGRLCFDGLKGGFSFDDRFFVSYGYIKADDFRLLGYESADDPEFQARLTAGTANVFLFDLLTNTLQTVTHMGPGQYALFPHFRSDGWIYFMVYDENTGQRFLMTSNHAIKTQDRPASMIR